MKKNNYIKILCLICITAVLISVVGCTKKDINVSNKDGGVVDFNQMSTQDGTAVISQQYTDDKGKKQTATEIVDVDFLDKPIFESSGLISRKDFATEIGPKHYGIPQDVAEKIPQETEKWKEFNFTRYVENKSDKILACKSVRVENNGANGIFINTNLDAEFTTGGHSMLPISVWAIADMNKFKSNDEIDADFDKMKIYLEYTLVDDALGDIDWENAEIKTMQLFRVDD